MSVRGDRHGADLLALDVQDRSVSGSGIGALPYRGLSALPAVTAVMSTMRPIAAWNRRVAAAVVAAVLLVGAIVVAAVLFAGPQAGGPPSGVSTFPSAAPTTGGTSATPTNAEQGILAAGAVLPLSFRRTGHAHHHRREQPRLRALPQIIDRVRQAGYSFVTPDSLL